MLNHSGPVFLFYITLHYSAAVVAERNHFKPFMHNVPKFSNSLWKSGSICYKIFKAFLAIFGPLCIKVFVLFTVNSSWGKLVHSLMHIVHIFFIFPWSVLMSIKKVLIKVTDFATFIKNSYWRKSLASFKRLGCF